MKQSCRCADVIFVVIDDVFEDGFVADCKPLIIPKNALAATSFLMTPLEIDEARLGEVFDGIEIERKYCGLLYNILKID